MNFNLSNNDIVANIISLVKGSNQTFYTISSNEYWIGEYWNSYIDLKRGTLEKEYFNYIKKFQIDYEELKYQYKSLERNGDKFAIYGNLPTLYVDFDLKLFYSRYFEQALENRLPASWTGKYIDILKLIPPEFKYWNEELLNSLK